MKERTTPGRLVPMTVGLITAMLTGSALAQPPAPPPPAPPAGQPAAPGPGQASVPPPGAPPADGAQGPQVKVERGAGGKKIYRITDAIRIEGKIQKPEAFYVLQKSSINYDWLDLKQDFIPKILDSVSRAPF